MVRVRGRGRTPAALPQRPINRDNIARASGGEIGDGCGVILAHRCHVERAMHSRCVRRVRGFDCSRPSQVCYPAMGRGEGRSSSRRLCLGTDTRAGGSPRRRPLLFCRFGTGRAPVQGILHHEARRYGYGLVDLPVDCRGSRRTPVGVAQNRWPRMTATNQSQQAVFVVDDDDSVRLSLSNLSIGWLAG
jgi:hypothetical protein